MTEQDVRDYLTDNGYEDTIIYSNPSYSEAFIGVTSNGIAIYDYDRMVQCLVEDDGMDEMEAMEWIDFNCVGSRGEGLPIVLNVGNPNYMCEKARVENIMPVQQEFKIDPDAA